MPHFLPGGPRAVWSPTPDHPELLGHLILDIDGPFPKTLEPGDTLEWKSATATLTFDDTQETRMSSANRKADIATRIQALQAELARLEVRPDEPNSPSAVVLFEVKIHDPVTVYQYAAVKSPQGWRIAGPRSSNHSVSWEALLDWVDRMHVDGLAASRLRVVETTAGLLP